VVDRFVAGENLDQAMAAVADLAERNIAVTLDHLGEGVTSRSGALASRDAYLRALDAIGTGGYAKHAEVSIKLSAFGQALPSGHDLAIANVTPVVEAASAIGTTVTLDMEEAATVDSTLAILQTLRATHPDTGAVLQSYLHRTRADAAALATTGSRVRLVKGAYREDPAVALQSKADVDRAYEQCLQILMHGSGYPMVGSHDPRMISHAIDLATQVGRARDTFEFQMLYGIRVPEQNRLAADGYLVRAYVPFGSDWYGYFMRRLAERPANVLFFVRALTSRK
jgi:proline dehydrogenase